jgi:hypothetical protein
MCCFYNSPLFVVLIFMLLFWDWLSITLLGAYFKRGLCSAKH